MSDLSIELSLFYEPFMNHSINLTYDSLSLSEIKTISKTKFAQHYHLLCKKCGKIPKLRFLNNLEIKYECHCKDLSIDEIHKIYDYLYYSDIIDLNNIKLKCEDHPEEKYCLYCTQCGINKCYKCAISCIGHKDKIIVFPLDKNILNKRDYIIEKIKDKNQTYIDDENNNLNKNFTTEDDNSNKILLLPKKKVINLIEDDSENNVDNDICDEEEDKYFLSKKINNDIINDDDKDEIINIINKNNNDKLFDKEYYLINLASIIVDDFQNYPNYELNEIISNLEKFIILYYDKFQKIDLKYEFRKEDIKDDSIEIFGEKFVENNKEKCFLIINEKFMDINNSICLKDIYDYFNIDLFNWPIKLNIELIEKQDNQMTDLSYMFLKISNLLPTSNFDDFDFRSVTNAEFLFCNCSSIIELPDISNLNFSNVTNMSYMFFGCKSLKELPDISKWNTNKLVNIESMFENCESLTFLPDISKWNKNKNIINKNKLFRNCKSLEILPDLKNLFSEEELKEDYIFEGCIKLEEKSKENNVEVNITLSERLDLSLNKLCSFYNKILDCLKNIGYCCLGIIYILLIILGIYYIFYHIYVAFHLDKSKEHFNDPTVYSYIANNINISHIAKIKNITNSSKLEEISQNKEDFIKKELNFTHINDNITFETSQKYLKICSIIIVSILFLNVLLALIIFFLNLMKITNSATIICRIITVYLIIDIIDLIIEINEIIIIKKIQNSFYIYKQNLKKLFGMKLINEVLKESNSFDDTLISLVVNMVISLILIFLNNSVLPDVINRRKEEWYDLFTKNKNIIDSNNNNHI